MFNTETRMFTLSCAYATSYEAKSDSLLHSMERTQVYSLKSILKFRMQTI